MPGGTSSVLEFYDDATIFITGGTGFLGKVLLEKLLRVFPNVVHIYLLIRVKKGKDPTARLEELFLDPLFNRLRKEKPDFQKRVTCIPGDVSSLRLGMSDSYYELLTKEVTHVFHSAATVRFTEYLKSAININVLGTREIVTLCNKCSRLKVFVHVSTAYANCVNKIINEDYCETPLASNVALSLVENLSEDRLNSVSPELIKPWPNTYTFTKAIAESIVRENAKSIPSLIFRPGIVMGTLNDPIEGWIDNIYGPTGVIVAVGIGLMRVLLASSECEANIVPVDLTVNAILSCAWEIGNSYKNNAIVENSVTESSNVRVGHENKKEVIPKIYNFVADERNRLTWGSFLTKTHLIGIKVPSERAIWYYTLTLTKIKLLYFSLIFFLHFVPAVFIDTGLLLLGKKPQMVKAYQKIHTFTEATGTFSSRSWHFTDNNMKNVWSRLSDRDKALFYFDMEKIDWDAYLKSVIMGIRHFLLKEPDSTLPAARRKMFFFWIGHRMIQFSFLAFCFWILSKILFASDVLTTQLKDSILMTNNSIL